MFSCRLIFSYWVIFSYWLFTWSGPMCQKTFGLKVNCTWANFWRCFYHVKLSEHWSPSYITYLYSIWFFQTQHNFSLLGTLTLVIIGVPTSVSLYDKWPLLLYQLIIFKTMGSAAEPKKYILTLVKFWFDFLA